MKINPTIVSTITESIDPLNHERTRGEVKIEIDYFNNLGLDIVVLDRRGIEFKIPCRFNPAIKDLQFKIYETFHLLEGVKLGFNDSEKDSETNILQQKFLDSLHMDSKAKRTSRKTTVCTTVSIDDLRKGGNCLYVKQHDLVIYISKPGTLVIHPATVSKVINGLNVGKTTLNNFEFNIRINDPHGKIGDRFINISGLIYKITPIRDHGQMEGVIISTSSAQLNGDFVNVPMTIEEFKEKVKTYKSFEEAELYGNMEEVAKKRLQDEVEALKHSNFVEQEKLKNESLKRNAEADEIKSELAKHQAELKHQEAKHKKELDLLNAQLDREKHEMDWQSLQRKNYYEERSYDRKDSSEILKWIPAVLAAGLFMFFK